MNENRKIIGTLSYLHITLIFLKRYHVCAEKEVNGGFKKLKILQLLITKKSLTDLVIKILQ